MLNEYNIHITIDELIENAKEYLENAKNNENTETHLCPLFEALNERCPEQIKAMRKAEKMGWHQLGYNVDELQIIMGNSNKKIGINADGKRGKTCGKIDHIKGGTYDY